MPYKKQQPNATSALCGKMIASTEAQFGVTQLTAKNIHQPIKNPLSAKWNFRVSGPDMINLMKGFAPQDMDDKWMCCTAGPADQGLIRVRMCRSWSSNEMVALIGRVTSDDEAAIAKEGGEIVGIEWPAPEEDEYDPWTEESSKEFAVGFCRHLLECNLEP
ncbi:atp dependent dna helicase [Fusarium austroafricanum]|uniref:Atp dependent dna helicase n=1 Tax=Fusarium austroafricanum TaxID=2364996 RepID=A0A8H4KN41_9HYPO|nr:atp dependent dna helicase [Fusarium austroafricanum]